MSDTNKHLEQENRAGLRMPMTKVHEEEQADFHEDPQQTPAIRGARYLGKLGCGMGWEIGGLANIG